MFAIECSLLRLLQSFHSREADVFFMLISNRWAWIPFYLLLAYFCYSAYKKQFVKILLSIALLITLSDQAAGLVKRSVGRERPCHHAACRQWVRSPGGCGGLFGFYSSHASNSMALALFLAMLFRGRRVLLSMLFCYVLLVGYSRIYLGAHFPGDILAGYFAGACFAIVLMQALINIPIGGHKLVLLRHED
ncbi:MAG: phosphatase PAP2 family protein [Bacteroidota bacterium]|jgi:undecaprenyl-diphosphatase